MTIAALKKLGNWVTSFDIGMPSRSDAVQKMTDVVSAIAIKVWDPSSNIDASSHTGQTNNVKDDEDFKESVPIPKSQKSPPTAANQVRGNRESEEDDEIALWESVDLSNPKTRVRTSEVSSRALSWLEKYS